MAWCLSLGKGFIVDYKWSPNKRTTYSCQVREEESVEEFETKEEENFKHRLERTKAEASRINRTRLNEKSPLIFGCDELRKEVKNLQRKLEISNEGFLDARAIEEDNQQQRQAKDWNKSFIEFNDHRRKRAIDLDWSCLLSHQHPTPPLCSQKFASEWNHFN
jgi:hypothetical protein